MISDAMELFLYLCLWTLINNTIGVSLRDAWIEVRKIKNK